MTADAARADAKTLANLADRFEQRVATLIENIDESWGLTGADAANGIETSGKLGNMAARKRPLSRLYLRCCGSWPTLLDLLGPASGLSLLERKPLHARLCALALLSRPGAVRSCVERGVREALANALGPAYSRLRESSVVGGAPLPAAATAWSPLEWACVGYADLVHVDAWSHQGLRQMVRLSLPQHWTIDRSRRHHPRSQVPATEALERLESLFEEMS